MEYHCNKATDAANGIFEKGLETFLDESEFVLRYLGFLISINDENNARALFERVIGTFTPDKARPLRGRWSRYEYQFGDLEALLKLERRMPEVYTNDPPIKRFAERYKYLGTDAIAIRDLGFTLSRQGSGSSRTNGTSTLGRTDTQISLLSNAPSQPQSTPSTSKRPPSPEPPRRRDESRAPEYGPPVKRARGGSRERDRDRWDGSSRRRYNNPGWDRERDRDSIVRQAGSVREERESGRRPSWPILTSYRIISVA